MGDYISKLYTQLGTNDFATILAFIVGFVSTIPFNVNTTDVANDTRQFSIFPGSNVVLFIKILVIGIIFATLYAIIIKFLNYVLPEKFKPIFSILMIIQLFLVVFWLSFANKMSMNIISNIASNIAISKRITSSS